MQLANILFFHINAHIRNHQYFPSLHRHPLPTTSEGVGFSRIITDTTFTNIVCEDSSGALLTHATPLLHGTMRQHLLVSGLLREADIRPEDLPRFPRIHLINAMNGLGDLIINANVYK